MINLFVVSVPMFLAILSVFSLLGGDFAYVPSATSDQEYHNCPLLEECALNCKYGYAVNKDGCEVCECQEGPCSEDGKHCRLPTMYETDEKDCRVTKTCDKAAKSVACPDITCQTFCKYGFVKNTAGCEICKCKKNPCKDLKQRCVNGTTCIPKEDHKGPLRKWTATCVPDCPPRTCHSHCGKGYVRDENDCQTCICKGDFCDGIVCPVGQSCIHDSRTRDFHRCVCTKSICNLSCQFGLARDCHGCQICKCVANPCQFVTCQNYYICVPTQEEICLEMPCPYKAKCKSINDID